MPWLIPCVIATMTGTIILTFCYWYVYLQDRKKYLKIWAVSWGIYFIRYVFMLAFLLWQKNSVLLIGNQLASLFSGTLLLYGSCLFVGKKFPKVFWGITMAGTVWIFVSILGKFPFMLMSLPTFGFLAAIYIWTGIVFYKNSEAGQKEFSVIGFAFIAWGIHKADYPFLRPIAWAAPWGYLVGAVLEFITAIGILIVYFRKTKDELIEKEKKLAENERRLLDAQRIAKVGDWNWELETDTLTWSEETYRIFGKDPAHFEVTVKAFENTIHPDDYDRFIRERETALKENRNIDIEHRIVLPDQSIRYVHEISSVVKGDDGRIVRVFGTVQDISETRRIEEHLIESEKKYRQLFELAQEGIWVIDEHNKTSFVNPAMARMLGYSIEEMTGRPLFDFMDEEGIRISNRNIERRKQGIQEQHDFEFIRKDGQRIYTTMATSPILGEGGEYRGALAGIVDITMRKKAEQELISSNQRYKMLFDNTPVPIWEEEFSEINRYFKTLKAKGVDDFKTYFDQHPEEVRTCVGMVRIRDVNEAAVRLHEAGTKEELLGNLDRIFTEKSLDVFKKELVALAGGATEFETHGEVQTLSGHKKYVLLKLTVQHKSKDSVVALITTTDITSVRKYEYELRMLTSAIDNSLNGFDIVDENGLLIYVNKAFVKMYGYDSADELIGTSPVHLCADPELPEKVIQNLKDKGEYIFEHKAKRKDGSLFDILMYARLTHDENQKQIYPTTSIDITDKVRLEEKLRHVQKMESIGNLAGGIAHEFNNILSIIMGNNELIMADLPDFSLSKESCEEIRMAGLRARDVVKQLLTFSRQDNSTKEVINIARVVEESMKLIRSSTPADIAIETDIAAGTVGVLANDTQLNQVLINLCSNAVDAMQETGGSIKVTLRTETVSPEMSSALSIDAGSYARLEIRDTGTGMEKSVVDKIFEPYFTTKEIGKGTGIGLAVVHGIVEKHGGVITADSRPGKGTCFVIRLPLSDRNPDEKVSNETDLHGGSEQILFVDDEQAISDIGRRHLETLGYSVNAFVEPLKALEAFKKNPDRYDLVITDMAMPQMTGDRLSAEILKIRPDISVIICTGYSSRVSETEAVRIGARAFLMKPLDRTELAATVRKVLDQDKQTGSRSEG